MLLVAWTGEPVLALITNPLAVALGAGLVSEALQPDLPPVVWIAAAVTQLGLALACIGLAVHRFDELIGEPGG